MAEVEVRDRVIWIRHVHGAPALAAQLHALGAGSTIRLRVAGVAGVWEKMKDRPSGEPTPGLKPVGEVATHWRRLFEKRRGKLVELSIETHGETAPASRSVGEKSAAFAAFLELAARGWRSAGPYGAREDLHERVLATDD